MIALLDAPLFRGLDTATAEAVAGVFQRREIAAGEVVFREGDAGDSLVVVLDGLFELLREDAGGEVHLADVEPGRVVGLVALVDPGPRTATLRALEDATVAVLDHAAFKGLWDAQGDAASQLHLQLAVSAAHELRSANRKLLDLLAEPLTADIEALPIKTVALARMRAYQASFFEP